MQRQWKESCKPQRAGGGKMMLSFANSNQSNLSLLNHLGILSNARTFSWCFLKKKGSNVNFVLEATSGIFSQQTELNSAKRCGTVEPVPRQMLQEFLDHKHAGKSSRSVSGAWFTCPFKKCYWGNARATFLLFSGSQFSGEFSTKYTSFPCMYILCETCTANFI